MEHSKLIADILDRYPTVTFTREASDGNQVFRLQVKDLNKVFTIRRQVDDRDIELSNFSLPSLALAGMIKETHDKVIKETHDKVVG